MLPSKIHVKNLSNRSGFDSSPFRFFSCHLLHQSLIRLILLHLSLLNLSRVDPHLFRLLGVLGLLGFGDNLAEASMLRVFLIIVRALLGLQLGTKLVEHYREDAIDGFLVGAVTVPDGDEVRVKADGEGDAAEVILCK